MQPKSILLFRCIRATLCALRTLVTHASLDLSYGLCWQGPYRVIIEHIIPCPESLVDIPFWVKVRLVRHRRDPSVFSIFANYTTHFLWTEEKDVSRPHSQGKTGYLLYDASAKQSRLYLGKGQSRNYWNNKCVLYHPTHLKDSDETSDLQCIH